jgi:hypothetical protein
MDRFTREQIGKGMFNSDQVAYMEDLAAAPRETKCASGWHFLAAGPCDCGTNASKRVLEDELETESVGCPCCARPLLVDVDVINTPDGGLAINYVKISHRDTPEAAEQEAALDELPRRREGE